MASPLSIPSSPSGNHGTLSLRKAVFYFLVFSYLGSGLSGVSADQSVMEELLHDMEQALGISTSGDVVTASSALTSSTQDASLSLSSSGSALLSTSTSSFESASSSALPSSTDLDQAATSVSLVTTTAVLPTPSSALQNSSASNSSITQTPAVFAHVIVGNTYNYTAGNWLKDITLAASKGIDAFALNIGSDNWEPSQVANAFAAAGQYNANRPKPDLSSPNVTTAINGTNSTTPGPFKLFMSFDMGSLPCSSPADAQLLQTYIKTYANNTNQMMYNGRMLVSTFAGESCTFGTNSLDQAWMNAVKPANASMPSVWFVPSFFVDPDTYSRLSVIDGAFHWNSAWPMGNYNVTFAPDLSYINNLGNRTYMASVAPWFFTHYGPQSYNKNFIYRGDDWLFAQRWELLVQNRTLVPLTQVLTWNDFGESHYLGPIEGMQPQSQAWVNGFDHQPWLDLMQYYISAYKTGSYPAIGKDRVFLWGRLYPTNATTTDPVAKPDNWPWTQDYLWSVALLTSPANVTLSCGTSSQTTQVPAGLAKLKLRLSTNCAVKAVVTRNSATVLSFSPAGFNFNTRPSLYNYNAFVAASPA